MIEPSVYSFSVTSPLAPGNATGVCEDDFACGDAVGNQNCYAVDAAALRRQVVETRLCLCRSVNIDHILQMSGVVMTNSLLVCPVVIAFNKLEMSAQTLSLVRSCGCCEPY